MEPEHRQKRIVVGPGQTAHLSRERYDQSSAPSVLSRGYRFLRPSAAVPRQPPKPPTVGLA